MLSAKSVTLLLAHAKKHTCEGIGKGKACVRIEAIAQLPTAYGNFHIVAFRNNADDKEHVAFVHGDIVNRSAVPVRIHSECLTGDVAHSLRCDCHDQLVTSLRRIGKMKYGVLIYLRQEGRGIGLINKIKAYMLQDAGMDTFEANRALGFKDDERDFSIAAHMLKALRIKTVQLMTNNPEKIENLESLGIPVEKRLPLSIKATKFNRFYLQTKAKKGGHLLKPSKRKTKR